MKPSESIYQSLKTVLTQVTYIVLLSGIMFWITYAGFLKVLYPSTSHLPIRPYVQILIGLFQLFCTVLLYIKKWRHLGIQLSALQFFLFALFWSTNQTQSMLFSLGGFIICIFLGLYQNKYESTSKRLKEITTDSVFINNESSDLIVTNERTILHEKEEDRSLSRSSIEESLSNEKDSSLQIQFVEEEPKLWMETIEGDDLLDWIYGDEKKK